MNKCKILAFAILLSLQLVHAEEGSKPSAGGGGWRESYGGDSNIMEFKYFAKELVYVLTSNNYPDRFNLQVGLIKDLIDQSKVECRSNLILDGEVKDAINYPHETPQRITLDCGKWSKLTDAQKYGLAIHEYLPLNGFDDSSYAYSEDLYSFFNQIKQVEGSSFLNLTKTIQFCDTDLFRKYVAQGANVFKNDRTQLNTLQYAVDIGCKEIVKDLIDLGVPYLSPYQHALPHYGLIGSNYYYRNNTTSVIKDQSIDILKMLIQKWPEVATIGFYSFDFVQDIIYALPSYCISGSNIMHLLASSEAQLDLRYIKQLQSIGFSIDIPNSCGQTARSFWIAKGIQSL